MTVDPLAARDEEAIGWFVLLRDSDSSAEDHRMFRLWHDADPANARAWRDIGLLWEGLEPGPVPLASAEAAPLPARDPAPVPAASLPPERMPEIAPGSGAAPAPVGAGAQGLAAIAASKTGSVAASRACPPSGSPAAAPGAAVARRGGLRRMVQGLALAASLAGLGIYLMPPGFGADYRAGIGLREIVVLEDGSQVELGTGAALDVDFTADRRMVRLITGEAFFTVTPDMDRPFVVQAGEGEVVVRGTAFNLRIDDDVRLTVVEHSVAVSAGPSSEVLVSEGEEARFSASGVSPVTASDPDRALAWRHDRLIFIDSPLAAVLDEIGRYRRGHVSLIGSGLADLSVTAVFDSRDPDGAIETIARSLGLKIRRASNLLVVLSRN